MYDCPLEGRKNILFHTYSLYVCLLFEIKVRNLFERTNRGHEIKKILYVHTFEDVIQYRSSSSNEKLVKWSTYDIKILQKPTLLTSIDMIKVKTLFKFAHIFCQHEIGNLSSFVSFPILFSASSWIANNFSDSYFLFPIFSTFFLFANRNDF